MTNSTEFPRGFPRKLEGVVGKQAGNTERKPGRVREETLGQAKTLGLLDTRITVCDTFLVFFGKEKILALAKAIVGTT